MILTAHNSLALYDTEEKVNVLLEQETIRYKAGQ